VLFSSVALPANRRSSAAVLAAVAILVVSDVLYLLVTEAGNLGLPRVRFIAAYVGGLALMAALGQIAPGALRIVFLSAGASGMLLLAVLAGPVPGSPLLLAGGLVVSALVRFVRTRHMLPVCIPLVVIGVITAWFVLAWGLETFSW